MKNSFIDKLKERWGVKSSWDVFIILLVFACTGFTIVYIKRLFGITIETPILHRIGFYVFVLLIYQIILLVYGFVFGKYLFFLNFEKRMFRRIIYFFKKENGNKP